MGVVSAKNGSGTWGGVAIEDVTDISITLDANIKEYASSSTAGNISRRAGHTNKTGSFTVKDEALVAGMVQGGSDALVLKSSAAVTLFTGTVMIHDIAYSVPIEAGDIVEATVNWGQMAY